MPKGVDLYSSKFTVITPTHHEGLNHPFIIRQWNILGDLIDKIIIVWDKPVENSLNRMKELLKNNSIKVEFVVNRTHGTLNNRFLPFKLVRTKFVFQLDDDILIRPKGIIAAFETATLNPLKLVSFHGRHRIGRDHSTGAAKSYESHWPKSDVETGHLGLTAAGMLATKYMELYWSEDAKPIRDFVEEQRNCEDIAMNYVIEAELRRLARKYRIPVKKINGGSAIHIFPKLKGMSWVNISKAVKGISEGSNHMSKRNLCVRTFEKMTGFRLDMRETTPAVNWEATCPRGSACETYFPNEIRVNTHTFEWEVPIVQISTKLEELIGFVQPKLQTKVF